MKLLKVNAGHEGKMWFSLLIILVCVVTVEQRICYIKYLFICIFLQDICTCYWPDINLICFEMMNEYSLFLPA